MFLRSLFQRRRRDKSHSSTGLATIGSPNKSLVHAEHCREKFQRNYDKWNQETNMLSSNVFDNSHFRNIVNMGKDAVPMIYDELKKGETPLVYALDMIFPGTMQYNGFVTLKEACDQWSSTLRKTGRFS